MNTTLAKLKTLIKNTCVERGKKYPIFDDGRCGMYRNYQGNGEDLWVEYNGLAIFFICLDDSPNVRVQIHEIGVRTILDSELTCKEMLDYAI